MVFMSPRERHRSEGQTPSKVGLFPLDDHKEYTVGSGYNVCEIRSVYVGSST